ncbi:MAG TPA: methyl-accepting chemotaxis protein [Anaerovoracaceae bacterium]|nr:methyl-accepting chemotaxis protein [Anaerovoracaceae bacterium]
MLIGKKLIDHFLAVGPYIKEIFGRDVVVWVTDTEKVLGYFPGEHLKIEDDNPYLTDDDPMLIAMREKRTIKGDVPLDLFGVPLKEVDVPIFDVNLKPVGCVAVAISLDQETKVTSIADQINEAMEDIIKTTNEVAISAENIRSSEVVLRENITEIGNLIKEIGNILSFTEVIATQTNLLGVNAAIEAARAGEHGLGFNIVADEIRKLSIESMKTARNIENLIARIDEANRITLKNSESAYAATEGQVAATIETEIKINELKGITEQLSKIAKEF